MKINSKLLAFIKIFVGIICIVYAILIAIKMMKSSSISWSILSFFLFLLIFGTSTLLNGILEIIQNKKTKWYFRIITVIGIMLIFGKVLIEIYPISHLPSPLGLIVFTILSYVLVNDILLLFKLKNKTA